jgi:hypothetical protein
VARSRNIKPALFKNELLGEADPLLTILFQGLWCLADRDGKLEDRPKRIKAEIFPYRELPDFNGYLTELAQLGFIDRYSVGKLAIIKVLEFSKHQSPHKTEKASELPERCEDSSSRVLTVVAPLDNESVTDEAALIPDSLNPIKPADESAYAFEGEKIKLNQKDYENCKLRYPLIDLDYHLGQLDMELRESKKWFQPMHSKLNYRNKTPVHQKAGESTEMVY